MARNTRWSTMKSEVLQVVGTHFFVSGDYITGLFGECVGGSAGSELVAVALWASGKDVD